MLSSISPIHPDAPVLSDVSRVNKCFEVVIQLMCAVSRSSRAFGISSHFRANLNVSLLYKATRVCTSVPLLSAESPFTHNDHVAAVHNHFSVEESRWVSSASDPNEGHDWT